MGIATIADHEQLIAMYPMRISDIASKLGLSNWNYVNNAIKQLHYKTGFNLKDSNNIYHVDIGVNENQPLHRYSIEALELLRKVLNNEEFTVIVNGSGEQVTVSTE